MNPFQSAHDLLEWACEDIAAFDVASQTFLDLKHSLDHAIGAAITLIRGRPAGDVHFLWSDHPNAMRSRLAKIPNRDTEPKYPPELWKFFETLEPYPTGVGYPGGSDELIAFSKIANSTKHAIALATAPRAHVQSFSTQMPFLRAFIDNWDGEQRELTICHVSHDAKLDMNLEIATNITFADVSQFREHAAVLVLEELARAVSNIIDELEIEVCDILAHRGRS